VLGLLEKILQAKAAVESGDAPHVTISLDLSDPRAQRLAELAKKLLLPTTKIHKTGLTTKTGMIIPERAEEFIEVLRREVGDEVMDDLASDLRAQIQARQRNTASGLGKQLVSDPGAIAATTKSLLSEESFRDALSPSEKTAFGNIADALERGEASI